MVIGLSGSIDFVFFFVDIDTVYLKLTLFSQKELSSLCQNIKQPVMT